MVTTDSGQCSFDLWPRQHDLPPRWDGLPVEWSGWQQPPVVYVCPPPRRPDRCDTCASERQPSINIGRVWTDPATAPQAIGRARLRRGRHLVCVITAMRCNDCGHDRVLELSSGMTWDLDETDYTDDGSWDNRIDR